MPQMAPILWNMILLVTFIIMFISMAKFYFIMNLKTSMINNKKRLVNKISNKPWLW